MSNIPTKATHPGLTDDELEWLRLEWCAARDPAVTSVRKCTAFSDSRYHVMIHGAELTGHWFYGAAWYLLDGAQCDAGMEATR